MTVLERSRVGDTATASFGLTRLVRNDYRDPAYARLAFEARQLWRELERECGERLLVDCGCLNLVKDSVTPDLGRTYAVGSYAVLEQLRLRREAFSRPQLAERFPQFDADGGWLDVDAGFADLAAVARVLREGLRARGVTVAENTGPRTFCRTGGTWTVFTEAGPVESDALVITAGLGTNEVLGLLPGCSVRFPLRPGRPSQSKYFVPPAAARDRFTEAVMPVFAYLDIGIYGHPIYDGTTPGVKIGFYNPPDVARMPSRIGSVEDFVAECMPGLRGAEVVDVATASGVVPARRAPLARVSRIDLFHPVGRLVLQPTHEHAPLPNPCAGRSRGRAVGRSLASHGNGGSNPAWRAGACAPTAAASFAPTWSGQARAAVPPSTAPRWPQRRGRCRPPRRCLVPGSGQERP